MRFRQDAAYFAQLYRDNALTGAHVIKLGPNNDDAAKLALRTWPQGLQIGGGIDESNAATWIEAGADKVIVTSYLFPNATFDLERLQRISALVGKDSLVVDLSCRRVDNSWRVAMNKWQTITDTEVNKETLEQMAEYCCEFLVHAADVEGLCRGIDQDLVVGMKKKKKIFFFWFVQNNERCFLHSALGLWSPIPCTYAGGAYTVSDLEVVDRLTHGRVDLTFGSALDIFGGKTVKFEDCVKWNQQQQL